MGLVGLRSQTKGGISLKIARLPFLWGVVVHGAGDVGV